jgi:prepilin-type N-terminal cleavage/methylation domain-containing protein
VCVSLDLTDRGDGLMRAAIIVARRRPPRDAGFGLVEMLIAMLVLSIIVPVAYGAIRNLTEQRASVNHLVESMEQDETAGQTLVQYLHAATNIAPVSTSSSLVAVLDDGYSTTGAAPGGATLTASCTGTATAGVGRLVVSLGPVDASPTSTSTFYVSTTAPSSCAMFRYGNTGEVDGSGSLAWKSSASASTVAVGITATFLPGPSVPTEGAAARLSTLETEIYLQDVATATTVVAS